MSHEGGPIRIVGIGGSMRTRSKSHIVLRVALDLAAERGAAVTMADVLRLDLPLFSPDRPRAEEPASVDWLIDQVRSADAVLLCSPTYHGTISGAVKNALDYLDLMADGAVGVDQTLAGKIVGLVATGGGAANVLTALYQAARALDGIAAPTIAQVANDAIDVETGTLKDPRALARLGVVVDQVIDLATRLRR